jgi:hypothetical protein
MMREAGQAKVTATSEALAIVANAQDDADNARKEADAYAVKARADADVQVRELVREARLVTTDVQAEGLELHANLRDMGDSLRSNAERLLGDIQSIHSRMVAELDRIDGGASRPPTGPSAPRVADSRGGSSRGRGATSSRSLDRDDFGRDELDVPEFIPPS